MTETYFEGDDIIISEMPFGCVVIRKDNDTKKPIVVGSLADAILLRDSLNKLIDHLINHNIGKQP